MQPQIYTLNNGQLEVGISDLGATLTKMIVSDRTGKPVDVLLGFDRAEDYTTPAYLAGYPYLGSCIGRYANRIARGKFVLHGKEYLLAINNGTNHLHGGLCGFDQKYWTVEHQEDNRLVMSYTSPDGEEGYPGTVKVQITFTLEGKQLTIRYQAETDQDCYVSLTHHPYFNLNPAAADIRNHALRLFTDCYLKTENLIPDGSVLKARGHYDFIRPALLQKALEEGGLDDCYVFTGEGKMQRVAELSETESGITLYVETDYPGLQVYTGRYLNVQHGKEGKEYGAYAGIALEAQYFPDSPNHPEFPSTLLHPGETYEHTTIYGFV